MRITILVVAVSQLLVSFCSAEGRDAEDNLNASTAPHRTVEDTPLRLPPKLQTQEDVVWWLLHYVAGGRKRGKHLVKQPFVWWIEGSPFVSEDRHVCSSFGIHMLEKKSRPRAIVFSVRLSRSPSQILHIGSTIEANHWIFNTSADAFAPAHASVIHLNAALYDSLAVGWVMHFDMLETTTLQLIHVQSGVNFGFSCIRARANTRHTQILFAALRPFLRRRYAEARNASLGPP